MLISYVAIFNRSPGAADLPKQVSKTHRDDSC